VEYAVKMCRLPEDRMLDQLIERGRATTKMVEAVAERLVPFHETTDSSPGIARYGDWAIRFNHRENVEQWTPYVGRTLTAEQHRICVAYGDAFFARKAEVLGRRVEEERIRRTHADLRSDAVCVTDGICIFDCVEFSRRLTLLDVARDVGFLDMDLRYRERADLAEAFVRRYEELANDPDMPEVLPFYAYYSACVRGKVENFLLDQPEVPEKEQQAATKRARRYFDLAVEYARSLPPALLVITYGLSASGKSTIAEEVAREIDATVISSDVTRKELAGMRPEERAAEEYRAGIYSSEVTKKTYGTMFERARPLLMDGRSVVLDASFLQRKHRRAAMRLGREAGAQVACIEVRADEAAIRARMRERAALNTGVSDASWEIYQQQKRRAQAPTEMPEERVIRVDTSAPKKARARDLVERLREISPLSVPD
jgi:aminoglycoside phosphotransferase family enzyme/predicted kinase